MMPGFNIHSTNAKENVISYNSSPFDYIYDDYRMIAIILYSTYQRDGIKFFTPNNFSQQLAYMRHKKDHVIPAHLHLPVDRKVKYTQETIFVRKGLVLINFYSEKQLYVDSRELKTGDVVLLVSGGHDFKMLEETELIEVKQGPYAGKEDKIRFKGLHE